MYFVPTKARLDFYYKVISLSITYGIILWGSCNKTQFRISESMHVRAAKIIHGLDWNTPNEEVLSKFNWKTLERTYLETLARLVHKCYCGISPIQIQELFLKRPCTYDFRRKNSISLPSPRTERMKKSITYKGSILWNKSSNETRDVDRSSTFKNALKFECLSDAMFD